MLGKIYLDYLIQKPAGISFYSFVIFEMQQSCSSIRLKLMGLKSHSFFEAYQKKQLDTTI